MAGGEMMTLLSYFHILEPSNGSIIMFLLVCVAVFCLGIVAGIEVADNHFVLAATIGGTFSLAWFLFLVWLFIGKSTWWSIIIRNWLNS
jgi:hypothetical protein